VSLGGDTDTNAAVAGSILGAIHGLSGSPAAWLDHLQNRDRIEADAQGLVTLAQRMA
jgi:ADP-ribosyl-[dinitrogen reductase] hydrolase